MKTDALKRLPMVRVSMIMGAKELVLSTPSMSPACLMVSLDP